MAVYAKNFSWTLFAHSCCLKCPLLIKEFWARKPQIHMHSMTLILYLLAEPVTLNVVLWTMSLHDVPFYVYFIVVYIATSSFTQLKILNPYSCGFPYICNCKNTSPWNAQIASSVVSYFSGMYTSWNFEVRLCNNPVVPGYLIASIIDMQHSQNCKESVMRHISWYCKVGLHYWSCAPIIAGRWLTMQCRYVISFHFANTEFFSEYLFTPHFLHTSGSHLA